MGPINGNSGLFHGVKPNYSRLSSPKVKNGVIRELPHAFMVSCSLKNPDNFSFQSTQLIPSQVCPVFLHSFFSFLSLNLVLGKYVVETNMVQWQALL
jgi:hypothetical protein